MAIVHRFALALFLFLGLFAQIAIAQSPFKTEYAAGRKEFDTKQYQIAELRFQTALGSAVTDQEKFTALYALAVVSQRLGRSAEARQRVGQALAIFPADASARGLLGELDVASVAKKAKSAAKKAPIASTTPTQQSAGINEMKSTPMKITHEQVCRATIAALMGRDPEIIEVTKLEDGIVYLSFIRQDDGTRWSQRCRIEGNKVVWATDTGRWRTHPDDGTIEFQVLDKTNEIEIVEHHFDGSKSAHKFKISSLS